MSEQAPPPGRYQHPAAAVIQRHVPQLRAPPSPPKAGRMNTRISGMRTSLIAVFVALPAHVTD
jgi:hypothetical protein